MQIRLPFNQPVTVVVAAILLVTLSLAGAAESWVFWSFKVMVRNNLGPGSKLHLRCTKLDYTSAYVDIWVPVREVILSDKEAAVIGRVKWYQSTDVALNCRYYANRRGHECSWMVFKYNTTNDLLDGLDRTWSVRPAGIFEEDLTDINGYALRFHHCKELRLKDTVL